ncbi:4-hydroxymandelate oxidase [Sulfuritortus calidifontis]|uniref:4-hydroxymandelate oxidase n=1 Tax=Sulfuritortus calidifontis TaxID=1914471 RepID=A0A4R3JWS8_9PROT|nr:alpha-hydroxy acid oxidase [Sulfuritortus calidifontis]TCS70888.1 4-hydroxymandelate oxidase [Sulfuritortus calidifontis]
MSARIDALPEGITTLADYEPLARACLNPTTWHYLHDGSGNGLSLAANRQAFETVPLIPRPLVDVRQGNTRLTLFGQTLLHPILLAPIAYQRLFHPDGECATSMAAAAQGGAMVISSLASQSIEEIVEAGCQIGVAPWFQLYWQGERERTLRLARRAEVAGCPALMLTVDAPFKQSTLVLPEGVAAENLEQPLMADQVPSGQSRVFQGWMAQAPTWDDLAWLRERIRLPLIVKGVLHPDDAERVVGLGCDGLVVSNHGGRVLDGAPASLLALPPILSRVAGRVPVLLDSGIRSGCDVFKALSLGASAVLLGRPYIWGLACAGAFGVAHVIRLMRDELEATMALCGCAELSQIVQTRNL